MSNVPMDQYMDVTGISTSDQTRFNTAATLDGDVRITHTTGTSAHTAATLISLTAATVTVPSTTFNATSTAMTGTLSVVGDTTLSNATASGTITATTRARTNLIEGLTPATDTLVIKSKKVKLEADVEITGNLDTVSTRDLLVKDKTITLGAVDADEDNVDDLDDTTRDGAGILIPGPPANLPVGKDAAKYEHSMRWKLNNGDFLPNGDAVVPHQRPAFEFSGGNLSLRQPDFTDRNARFFFAPYFTATVASLGLYYALDDGRVKLVHTFSTGVFGGPPVFTTPEALPAATVGSPYTTSIVATGAVTYSLFARGTLPAELDISSSGVITGTPTAPVNAAFTVRATGSVPSLFTDKAFTLVIS
jgi:hypothetical protein